MADTECYSDAECKGPNDRFLSKCGSYRDCGNSSQPFKCDLKFNRCLSVRQFKNCKNDNVCTKLEHLFLCQNGLCQNITSAFDCDYHKIQSPVNCKDKRNCIKLQGLYECHDGQCSKVMLNSGAKIRIILVPSFGKNLEQKLEYPKYAVGLYLMVPEVQETQMRFDFVLFFWFLVLDAFFGSGGFWKCS